MEGGAQLQREQAQRLAFNAKLSEAMMDVVDVADAAALKLADHGQEEQSGRREHGTGASEDAPEEGEEPAQAEGAGPHVDMLA